MRIVTLAWAKAALGRAIAAATAASRASLRMAFLQNLRFVHGARGPKARGARLNRAMARNNRVFAHSPLATRRSIAPIAGILFKNRHRQQVPIDEKARRD